MTEEETFHIYMLSFAYGLTMGERSECKGRLEYICVYKSISTYVDSVRVCRLLLTGHI